MSDGNNNNQDQITSADIAFLDHVRTMLIHTAELRVKNFNFFLIVAGITIVAFTKIDDPVMLRYIAGIGFILSGIFFILDFRNFQQIKDIRDDLEKIEPKFGITIHTVDQVPDLSRKKEGAKRMHFLISHTFGFRAIFVLLALISVFMLIKGADYIPTIKAQTQIENKK